MPHLHLTQPIVLTDADLTGAAGIYAPSHYSDRTYYDFSQQATGDAYSFAADQNYRARTVIRRAVDQIRHDETWAGGSLSINERTIGR